ncbi:hypothetical protein BD413DRAFT_530680 [Trametes elegans]|nr:hypothetical protein BD413DRAFT_530680 [Trametes elegans]
MVSTAHQTRRPRGVWARTRALGPRSSRTSRPGCVRSSPTRAPGRTTGLLPRLALGQHGCVRTQYRGVAVRARRRVCAGTTQLEGVCTAR